MLAPVGEQSGFISFYRIQLYQQLAEKGSAPLRGNCSELMWRIARRLLEKYGAPIFRLC